MNTKGTALLPVVLLSVGSSVIASLLAAWAVSELFAFTFHPSVVAALSASAAAAAAVTARQESRAKNRTRREGSKRIL